MKSVSHTSHLIAIALGALVLAIAVVGYALAGTGTGEAQVPQGNYMSVPF